MGSVFGDVLGAIGGLIGGGMSKDAVIAANDANRDMAYDFANRGIQMRVEDAKKAGIHPLAALGASVSSPGAVHVGATGAGDGVSQAGQNLGRAISSMSTKEERAHDEFMRAEARKKAALENKILESQASTVSQTNNPPAPGSANFIPGQGNSALVVNKPLERTVSQPGRLAQEAGWRPDVSFSRTDTGLTPMVPESLSESLEDDFLGKTMWRIRNQLIPNLTAGQEGRPARSQLPKGADYWDWSYLKQEWQPRSKWEGRWGFKPGRR